MSAPEPARCEETDARELLVRVNAGAPLVERQDHLRPHAPPVMFVQIPVAIEAIQAGFLAGYEAGHAAGLAHHVEHHRCARCYEAGAIRATAPTPNP